MKIVRTLSLSLFVFGFAGWFYIAMNGWIHPETLPLPLTHLMMWPREDTFGIVCFAVSFMAFIVWNYVRDENK